MHQYKQCTKKVPTENQYISCYYFYVGRRFFPFEIPIEKVKYEDKINTKLNENMCTENGDW